jgi:nitrate reductase gamma subunit
MHLLYAALAVTLLALLGALAGLVPGGTAFIAIVVPYAALLTLLLGVCHRVARWAASPVPFRIPTTCGQQRSLPWIRAAPLDNPDSGAGAFGRVALEVLLFRSLLHNSRTRIHDGRYVTAQSCVLWLGALAFHWSLLVVVLRHLRLAVEPTPAFVVWLSSIDGMLQIGAPSLLLTDLVLIASLGYLLLRRWWDPLLRYLSLFSDYFALLLLLAIAATGILMRHVARVDVVSIKQFALGLATFHPALPAATSPLFLAHLLLVSALAIYIPFSKLMHFGGALLSPTRNLANNSRRKRHINPWNAPVPTHDYAEWEHEFADKLKLAGLPLDKVDDAGPKAAN